MKLLYLFVMLCCLNLLTACTPDISANHYIAENVGQAQQVEYGKIIKAAPVQIASRDNTGSLLGTAAGATVGSAVGGTTRVNILGALGGAVIGGIAGHHIGKHVNNQTGIQYIVHLDNGKILSIVQGLHPTLHMGQRVMVLLGGRTRDRVIAA